MNSNWKLKSAVILHIKRTKYV